MSYLRILLIFIFGTLFSTPSSFSITWCIENDKTWNKISAPPFPYWSNTSCVRTDHIVLTDKAAARLITNNKQKKKKFCDLLSGQRNDNLIPYYDLQKKYSALNCEFKSEKLKYAKNINSSNKEKQTCFGAVQSWNNCFGHYKFSNGDEYQGEFKNGKYNGYGTFKFSNGVEYQGEFKNGKYNGIGQSKYKSGDKYNGRFKNNKKHGYGIYMFKSGNKYKGEFKNDLIHGRGEFSYLAGDTYIGEFKYGKREGKGTFIWANGLKDKGEFKNDKLNGFAIRYDRNGKILKQGVWKNDKFLYSKNNDKQSKNTKISSEELEKEKQKRKVLEQKLAVLKKEKQKRIEEERKRKQLEKKLAALQYQKKKKINNAKQKEIGSGFYVSKFRHIVTNQHVVNKCNKITVGDSISKQIPATLIASDKRNDLAILQTISMEMASADTKSFIQNLSIEIVPIVSGGLIRAEDVIGGEEIFVAGYPLGSMVSDSMRLVPGLVNATKGYENDITQFETDAIIRKGNSGGPIYDRRGNIVGVAVKRLNVSQSDNFNFAIKGTTVKQFLDANGVITSLANRTSQMSSTDIYKIASKQTVMIVCHR